MAETNLAALAAKLDEYIEVRALRRKMEADAEKLKEEKESPLRAEIMEALKASGSGAVGGSKMQATLKPKKTYQPADWKLVRKFIVENDAWELMQNRLSPPAIRERLAAGEEIPGIVIVEVDDLSITKL